MTKNNSSAKHQTPQFSLALLHPKYLHVWLSFGILYIIVNILPYRILFWLGRGLGKLGMLIAKKTKNKRIHIVRRNLALAFPEKSLADIDSFLKENLSNTGLALIETGIAWFWPSWRFKSLIKEQDISSVREKIQANKGILFCSVHSLNLEITARSFAELGLSGAGVYRPHNNLAYNFIQYWGRTHTGNQLIDRKDVKSMIKALKEGQRVWYLPDHDYGRNKSVFVPFFAVEQACTTTGTSILVYLSKCSVITASGFRDRNNKYQLITDPCIAKDYPQDDMTAAAAYINKALEKVILRAPERWMWVHRRYKTMPDPQQNNIRYK